MFRLPTSPSNLSCTIFESWRHSEDLRLYTNMKIVAVANVFEVCGVQIDRYNLAPLALRLGRDQIPYHSPANS